MFEVAGVGICDREADRDAVALARELLSLHRKPTLVHRCTYAIRGTRKARSTSASNRPASRSRVLDQVQPHAKFVDDPVEGLHTYGAIVDLLVIGAHDYTPIDHLLERSTSQRLADAASSPPLVLASGDPTPAHAGE